MNPSQSQLQIEMLLQMLGERDVQVELAKRQIQMLTAELKRAQQPLPVEPDLPTP